MDRLDSRQAGSRLIAKIVVVVVFEYSCKPTMNGIAIMSLVSVDGMTLESHLCV